MAANPFGAHQVGVDTADYMAPRYATGHDVVGRAGRRSDQMIRRSGTPLPRSTGYLLNASKGHPQLSTMSRFKLGLFAQLAK